jgi:hypothetical protein
MFAKSFAFHTELEEQDIVVMLNRHRHATVETRVYPYKFRLNGNHGHLVGRIYGDSNLTLTHVEGKAYADWGEFLLFSIFLVAGLLLLLGLTGTSYATTLNPTHIIGGLTFVVLLVAWSVLRRRDNTIRHLAAMLNALDSSRLEKKEKPKREPQSEKPKKKNENREVQVSNDSSHHEISRRRHKVQIPADQPQKFFDFSRAFSFETSCDQEEVIERLKAYPASYNTGKTIYRVKVWNHEGTTHFSITEQYSAQTSWIDTSIITGKIITKKRKSLMTCITGKLKITAIPELHTSFSAAIVVIFFLWILLLPFTYNRILGLSTILMCIINPSVVFVFLYVSGLFINLNYKHLPRLQRDLGQ